MVRWLAGWLHLLFCSEFIEISYITPSVAAETLEHPHHTLYQTPPPIQYPHPLSPSPFPLPPFSTMATTMATPTKLSSHLLGDISNLVKDPANKALYVGLAQLVRSTSISGDYDDDKLLSAIDDLLQLGEKHVVGDHDDEVYYLPPPPRIIARRGLF